LIKSIRVRRTWKVAAALATMTAIPAFANMIDPGTAKFTGELLLGTSGISFFNGAGTTANIFDPGVGVNSSTGSFAGLTGGTIANISVPVGPCTGAGCVGVITWNVPSAPGGVVDFDLTDILAGFGTGPCAGVGANSIGNECTPAGTPLTLLQTPTGVQISFSELGVAYIPPSSGGVTPIAGLFSATITAPNTITGVLAAIAAGTIGDQGYSASFTAAGTTLPTPEPSTILVVIAGLSLMALGKRSVAKRS
jgi:hypothetical protein